MFLPILLPLITSAFAACIAHREVGIPARHRSKSITARDGNARFTHYTTGLGACGAYSQPSEFVVALNAPQWNGGSHCWDNITLNYNGKTAVAKIVDLCDGCPYNALDLSDGLFGYFSDLGAGTIYGAWQYGTAAPPPARYH